MKHGVSAIGRARLVPIGGRRWKVFGEYNKKREGALARSCKLAALGAIRTLGNPLKNPFPHHWVALLCLALPAACDALAASASDVRQSSIQAGQSQVFPARDCRLSIAESARSREPEAYTFVDVRSVDDFSRHHVPGSINISPNELKTKTFLKDRPLVLVDTGHAEGPSIVTCEELRRLGFSNVKVLSGGLYGWHETFGNLEGSGHPDELRLVEPHTVDALLGDPDWLVVEVLPAAVKPAEFVLDHPSVLRLDASKQTIAAIEKAASQSEAKRVLIAGGSELSTSAATHVAGRDVFYIAGGRAAYRDHLHRQAAIAGKKQFVLQSEASCR